MADALELCSTAWGEREGYVFLSVLDRDTGEWEDKPYQWPTDRERVSRALDRAKRSKREMYWAPMVFSGPSRDKRKATDTNILWADLDEADPRNIPQDLKPNAWWETSPGRFQALWVLRESISPKLHQQLNKALTYKIGADKGTWNLTRVLRIPGTTNHKYPAPVSEARMNGRHQMSSTGLALMLGQSASGEGQGVSETPFESLPSPEATLRKYRRRLSTRAKQLLKARDKNAVKGTRSERLWELECLLAEAGMKPREIVAVCKRSVWNKFEDRHDEMERLSSEARKAVRHTGGGQGVREKRKSTEDANRYGDPGDEGWEEVQGDDGADGYGGEGDLDDELPEPLGWATFDRDHKPINWLVADVWGSAEVGFISGLPKSYKSWLALDLAISVATGTRFLGSFQAKRANVLLIQEEDPKPVMQDRMVKIGASKGLVYSKFLDDDTIEMRYALPDAPDLMVASNSGFQITEDMWMEWLEAQIAKHKSQLLILDPLMMMAEGFDEFKSFDMMAKVFKPLKQLRARTNCAICVVHHHKKGEGSGGAAMYGAVATWAWEECAIHLNVAGPGKVVAERFSKHARFSPLTIEVPDIEEQGWKPQAYSGSGAGDTSLVELIESYSGGVSIEEIAQVTNMGRDAVKRHVASLEEQEKIERVQSTRSPGQRGRGKLMWKVKT